MSSNTFNSASISMGNAVSISNTIAASSTSISSLTASNTKSFTNSITSPTTGTAIQDPVKTVLTKTLSSIATTSNLADKKISDLQTSLNSYLNKNSLVQVVGNKIVVTVTNQNKAQGQAEQSAIQSQVNSINSTLGVLQKTIGTLSTITSTISVLLTALTVMESLIAVNPAAATAYTVFKQAIKVVFLKDMLTSYLSIITQQLSQSSSQLSQMTAKFNDMQVTLNIQDNANVGNNITPTQAIVNVTPAPGNAQSYAPGDGKTYTLTVTKQADGQLVGKAVDSVSGQLVAQTAPSFISSSDDLINELKAIINA